MKADTYKLARDIVQNPWFVSNPENMMAIARKFLDKAPLEMEANIAELSEVADESPSASGKKTKKKCMIVPIHGTMTKYETCESYGTQQLADRISDFADDDSVVGVVLDIDSGGGSGNAVPPLIAAIKNFQSTGKPIYVHCDACGSAAYWVASQCDAIYMDNKMSSVGSIGAYYMFLDDSDRNPSDGSRWISVYARESEDKNLAYRQAVAGNVEPAQDELSALVKMFQDDVRNGRPGIRHTEKGVMSGKMFRTPEAISLGMADAQKSLQETVEAVFAISDLT